MNIYGVTFQIDNGICIAPTRYRNVIAKNEWDAEMQIYNLMRDREKKKGRILHFIDCDFWKVDLLVENYITE